MVVVKRGRGKVVKNTKWTKGEIHLQTWTSEMAEEGNTATKHLHHLYTTIKKMKKINYL
jgi:hypothetical protein